MSFLRRFLFFLVTAVCCLVLLGRGERTVRFSFGEVPENAAELTAVALPEDLPLLDRLPQLRRADLSGSVCYDELMAWGDKHPQTELIYTVALPGGSSVPNDTEGLVMAGSSREDVMASLPLLSCLPRLRQLDLGDEAGKYSADDLRAISEACPGVDISCAFAIGGREFSSSAETLALPELDSAGAERLAELLPWLPRLRSVDLGEEAENRDFDLDDVAALQKAGQGVSFLYNFSLMGKSLSTADRAVDLNHISMDDGGAAVRGAISVMPDLEYLDMDSCGVSNEDMAAIRDDFPDVKVVWRVWFGKRYSVRTDAERILASRPSVGGNLTDDNTEPLKYCTDVKYLDIGHNETLTDLSFIGYMTKLEVAILAMNDCSDCSFLKNCPDLEYLEIQTTEVSDLSPLKGLTKLRHLNICYLFGLTDISPLYGLDKLERLWIGVYDPIPDEQIERIQELMPNLEINTTTVDPTDGGWRYDGYNNMQPRYKKLVKQFGYTINDYAFAWNDPKY